MSGYDKFFKAARDNRTQMSDSKLDLKSLQKKSMNSEELKLEIQKRKIKSALNKKSKLKRSLPLGPVVFLVLAMMGLGVASQNIDEIENALSVVEIKLFGQAIAADSKEGAKSEDNTDTKVKTEEKKTGESNSTVAGVDSPRTAFTAEELALFKGLEDRRRALEQKEAELKKLEEELQSQRQELEKRLVQVEDVRRNIASQLEERVKVDQERVDQLVAFYSTMKPQQAAKIIETLHEDLAVEVMLKMKKKNAAEIMNLIDAQKAQRLSEKFAGYRRK